jgi:peptidoglycan hydrolase CwlO-like protein|tara:strand:+ start:45 stop:425 length:381 start_codon:yes stop_codon:yes gene_type:complete
MDWFKSKGGQVIALVTIVSTLAGFGYAGAGYVNRLENLETKVTGIATTKSGLQDIEKRFEAINTSISYINKSIDEGINISLKAQAESLVKVKTDIAEIKAQVKALDKEIDRLEARLLKNNDNPLAQ